MATLVTIPDLAVWTAGSPDAIAADDAKALMVVEKASEIVCDTAGRPEWEDDPQAAPRRARTIALLVASRAWTNPDGEKSSSTGPISGSVHEDMALVIRLSDYEIEELEKLGAEAGDGGLWVQPINSGEPTTRTLFLNDDTPTDEAILYANADDTQMLWTDEDTVV